MREIIVVGNSHTIALKAASQLDGIKVCRCVNEEKQVVERRADMVFEDAVELVKSSPGRIVVSALGGNQHQMYLLEHPEPFDFHEPGNDEVLPDHKIIPYSVMYDHFQRGIVGGTNGQQILALRRVTTGPMYHLGVPPPKEDEAHIRRRTEGYFWGRVKAGEPLTKASIRAKLWRLQRHVILDFCAKAKIEYVPVPAIAKDLNDFLKQEYYAPDATHANAAYGKLVLEQIATLAV